MLCTGALVDWENADFKSQCRLSPWRTSSVCVTNSEISVRINPLAWTWLARLLVRFDTWMRLAIKLLETRSTFVCALLRVEFAEPRVACNCALMFVGRSHSPSEPFGPLRLELICAKLVRMGLTIASNSSAWTTILS